MEDIIEDIDLTFTDILHELEADSNVVPKGYSVKILEVDDPRVMHIDATILALRPRSLHYNPERVQKTALREHDVLRDWELRAYPCTV